MSRLAGKSTNEGWSLESVQHLVLEGVSWELYDHLLKVVGNRPLRLTYDRGELEIMSPLPEHEEAKELIADLIKTILEITKTPRRSMGSATFRQQLKRRGLEPDSCFYIQNLPRIAGKKRISLPKDPPPDLAVEIDVTHRSIDRLPIYADLGVPEIWSYDGKALHCLVLEQGAYRTSEFGRAFPKLRVGDLKAYIRIAEDKGDHTAAVKAFRAWLKKQRWIK
jgi:Uma2 family endonuclease